ncbi:MAG: DUF1620 super [Chaenotheca gracillima]|nr:MAG: DUF1620 super [Chaenotheca gracillima]
MAQSPLSPLPLSAYPTIREKQIDCPEVGLSFHTLEAGHTPNERRPLLLLLHGFPEIAYSWRKVMPALAAAGYYVVAPDQRGFGRTTGWDSSDFAQADLKSFSVMRLVADVVVLVNALGYSTVSAVIGHDFGAPVASLCALTRPDMFHSVVMMSHPFPGTPRVSFDTAHQTPHKDGPASTSSENVHKDLANLPEPRKHYKLYFSTAPAAKDLLEPIDELQPFLRAYFHTKSADWSGNQPHDLKAWTAAELAKMPYYYVMPLGETMREAVARDMPSEKFIDTDSSRWLSNSELDVYVQEWHRTGFQGALNWYRCGSSGSAARDVMIFAGRTIDVPAIYIGGTKDWGTYQEPGALDRCAKSCSNYKGAKLIPGAGHWVQQEQPDEVVAEILGFLRAQ